MSDQTQEPRNDALRNYPLHALGDAVIMELTKNGIEQPGILLIVVDSSGNASSTTNFPNEETVVALMRDLIASHEQGRYESDVSETVQ